MHSYSIFVHKEKYGRFPRDVFDDTVLEFIGETSETSEASQAKTTFTRAIRGTSAWCETTPPTLAPPIRLQFGELHPSFAHANFAANAWEHKNVNVNTAKSTWTIRWKDSMCTSMWFICAVRPSKKRGTTLTMKRTKEQHLYIHVVLIYYSFSYWALYATDFFYIEHGKILKKL